MITPGLALTDPTSAAAPAGLSLGPSEPGGGGFSVALAAALGASPAPEAGQEARLDEPGLATPAVSGGEQAGGEAATAAPVLALIIPAVTPELERATGAADGETTTTPAPAAAAQDGRWEQGDRAAPPAVAALPPSAGDAAPANPESAAWNAAPASAAAPLPSAQAAPSPAHAAAGTETRPPTSAPGSVAPAPQGPEGQAATGRDAGAPAPKPEARSQIPSGADDPTPRTAPALPLGLTAEPDAGTTMADPRLRPPPAQSERGPTTVAGGEREAVQPIAPEDAGGVTQERATPAMARPQPTPDPAAASRQMATAEGAAVAVQVLTPRAARPGSPPLSAQVSPASVETLNAAWGGQTALPAAAASAETGREPEPLRETGPDRRPASLALGSDEAGPDDAAASDTARSGVTETPEARPASAAETKPAEAKPAQALGGSTPAQALAAQTSGLSGPTAAPLAAASPAPRAAPVTVAQQLMPVVVTLAGASGAASVTVSLDPVELGRVEISVRRGEDQKARVQVVAERPETLLLLLRDQPALDRALAQAGVGPEGRTLSFDLAPGQHQGQGDGAAGGRRDEPGPGSRRDREPGPEAPWQDHQRRIPRGALDIAV